jgi:hypothetical protein
MRASSASSLSARSSSTSSGTSAARYLDIYAADGDEFHNFAVTASSLPAGWKNDDALKEYTKSMADYGISAGYGVKGQSLDPTSQDDTKPIGGIRPGYIRGTVLFGMTVSAY